MGKFEEVKIEAKKMGWNPADTCNALRQLLYVSIYRYKHDVVDIGDVIKIIDEEYYDLCVDP